MSLRHNGFTLVELLVVVAVIAVLVGILLPALDTARVTARQRVCALRLQQIGVGFLAYADTISPNADCGPRDRLEAHPVKLFRRFHS